MKGKKSLCGEFCNWLLLPKLCNCFSPKIVRFQNGSNKVTIELSGVQFWSEIILVISNRATCSFDFEITRMISDQIAVHSVQLPLYTNLRCTQSFDVSNCSYQGKFGSFQVDLKRTVSRNNCLTKDGVDISWNTSSLASTNCSWAREVGQLPYKNDGDLSWFCAWTHHSRWHFKYKSFGENYPVEFSVSYKSHFFKIYLIPLDNFFQYCLKS